MVDKDLNNSLAYDYLSNIAISLIKIFKPTIITKFIFRSIISYFLDILPLNIKFQNDF